MTYTREQVEAAALAAFRKNIDEACALAGDLYPAAQAVGQLCGFAQDFIDSLNRTIPSDTEPNPSPKENADEKRRIFDYDPECDPLCGPRCKCGAYLHDHGSAGYRYCPG